MENTKSFEEKLQRLNEIVQQMEQKTPSLEESIALFHEGKTLIQDLEKTLASAEQSIQEVIEIDAK